jgi:hypothetical protein
MSLKENDHVWIFKKMHGNRWNKETKSRDKVDVAKLEGVFVKYDSGSAVVRVKTPIGFKEIKFSPLMLEKK